MTPTDRELLRRARARLDAWTYDARDRAFTDLFEGEDPLLGPDDLAEIDRIDSALVRETGTGLWGADEYGIVAADTLGVESPQVVTVYHPEIPDEGYHGRESLDEERREQLNDALWKYAERVATYLGEDLDAFLRRARREG